MPQNKKRWNKFLQAEGLPFITATHDIKNVGSGRVMQKLGMKYQYSYEEMVQPKDYLVTFRMYQLNFSNPNYVYRKYWNKYDKHFVEVVD